ncbi:MAG: hypothetical protein ABFD09_11630 [Proteiniphilum sp.]
MNNKKLLFIIVIFLAIIPMISLGKETKSSQEKYLCMPLVKNETKATEQKILNRYGIPFIEGVLPVNADGSAKIELGGQVNQIFLLGMTESAGTKCWFDPRDYSVRYFIGDEIGNIRLDYADGSKQVFPLILGESIWWGWLFYEYPEPFSSNTQLRKALAAAMCLYPPAPVEDGNYVAVIKPKPISLRSITLESSPSKKGLPVISGITVMTDGDSKISGTLAFPSSSFSPEFKRFVQNKTLCPLGKSDRLVRQRLEDLRHALYTSNENFKGEVIPEMPSGYSGPKVSFKGNIFAGILSNAFHYNVQDILNKVDEDGFYHTSTRNALSWGGEGFGTFRKNVGMYYNTSWSRDMGRSLQEAVNLGYTKEGTRCADYCLRMARLWEETPSLRFNGIVIPRHWSRVANRPNLNNCNENDGHGLITLFLYKLWQRLPDREEWLRSRWTDVKAAGDWILWQFANPKISGATDVLHTTGEGAGSKDNGYSVYGDYICMYALRALAQMANSIGETNVARQWINCANKMQTAISSRYIINDPKYGKVWTLDFAGWPHKSSVLGPLIYLADYKGFSPEDDDPLWRQVNAATYQRLIDTYQPFGFYCQAMGYGQGFVTQSALLLDRMKDATQMLDWVAKGIYDPRIGCYIVPEGCQIDSTGKFWYRTGDLGNGVQEAEIIKALRLVIGVDDTRPDRLRFFPRIPYDWNEVAVEKYPVLFNNSGKMETVFMKYKLKRKNDRMKLEISSDKDLGEVAFRLGPFEKRPDTSSVQVNSKYPKTSIEYSGDSWWVRFKMSVGLIAVTQKF